MVTCCSLKLSCFIRKERPGSCFDGATFSNKPYPKPQSSAPSKAKIRPPVLPRIELSVSERYQDQRATPKALRRIATPLQPSTIEMQLGKQIEPGTNKDEAVESCQSSIRVRSAGSDETIKPLSPVLGPSTHVKLSKPVARSAGESKLSAERDLFERERSTYLGSLDSGDSSQVIRIAQDLKALSVKIQRQLGSDDRTETPDLTYSSHLPKSRQVSQSRPTVMSPTFFQAESTDPSIQIPVQTAQSPALALFSKRKRIRPSVDSERSASPISTDVLADLAQKQIELDYAQSLNTMLARSLKSMQQRVARLERLSSSVY